MYHLIRINNNQTAVGVNRADALETAAMIWPHLEPVFTALHGQAYNHKCVVQTDKRHGGYPSGWGRNCTGIRR